MQHAEMTTNASPGNRRDSARFKKPRILLVEDYNPTIVMMTMFLEDAGYECVVAENGFDALEKFFGSSFDLVIMDLQLPDIDGLETTRRMRLWEKDRDLSPTPIIASSGNSPEYNKTFCRKTGMNDCLSKPFELAEMERKLDQWIPRSKSSYPSKAVS